MRPGNDAGQRRPRRAVQDFGPRSEREAQEFELLQNGSTEDHLHHLLHVAHRHLPFKVIDSRDEITARCFAIGVHAPRPADFDGRLHQGHARFIYVYETQQGWKRSDDVSQVSSALLGKQVQSVPVCA